ncbi:uncharacterized protein LOC113238682, partial [Hyposmocoma kahamanoa]|uniref:uncharacterized protein LOC113238682 n=1 Tax=Hyposmocoma kahamanoa TaxID=1477025 RepID=UPI000E6D871A
MIAYIALPCARCRCEGLGIDFCLDKQSYFHEDTDLDEQAGSVSEEKQMPIKSKPKEPEVTTTGREPRGVMENNSSMSATAARKPQSTDKYDDEAMLAKFAEEEDVDREDHVTQLQYLSDLAVNTDNEITSLH